MEEEKPKGGGSELRTIGTKGTRDYGAFYNSRVEREGVAASLNDVYGIRKGS